MHRSCHINLQGTVRGAACTCGVVCLRLRGFGLGRRWGGASENDPDRIRIVDFCRLVEWKRFFFSWGRPWLPVEIPWRTVPLIGSDPDWSGLADPFAIGTLGCSGLFVVCEISIFYISLSTVCCWCTERTKGLDRNHEGLSGVFATEALKYVEGIKYENTVWWIKVTVPAQILPSRWCIGRNHP